MKSRHPFRLITLIATLLFSAYFLVPSFLPVDALYRQYEDQNQSVPFYIKMLPRQGLNLGLDLRGGIYLELETNLADALKKRLEFLSNDIGRDLKEEPFAPTKTELETPSPDTYSLRVSFETSAAIAEFKTWFNKRYQGVWSYSRAEDKTLVYILEEDYRDRLSEQILNQAIESVRNRVDRYGVAEAAISRYGTDHLVVELPGVSDPDRVINIIRQTGQLEFKIVSNALSETELTSLLAETRQANAIPETYSKETVDKLNTALKDTLPEGTEIAFELIRDPVSQKVSDGVPYLLNKKTELTGDLLEDARVSIQDNEPHVTLSHNVSGTKILAEVTKANVGKPLAIVLDGNVVKAPVIREAIPNGQAQITLGYGNYQSILKEAEDLALVLREGALPTSLTISKRSLIGPTLGADSVKKGVTASLIGGVIVILFMVVYYKTSGVVADLSLFFNILLLLGTLAFLQASLTLPGIAGIALTIGMAVDANVIIFERIKDELSLGLPLKAAFERGYSNAMRAVIDANVTTLISGIVLYQFGTGPIKGFATTLMIGIGSTLLTAVVFSRWIQEALLERNGWSRIRI